MISTLIIAAVGAYIGIRLSEGCNLKSKHIHDPVKKLYDNIIDWVAQDDKSKTQPEEKDNKDESAKS